MGKTGKKANKRNRFRPGSHGGCEALLWEFRERSHLHDTESALVDKPIESPGVILIGAETLEEALEYLRFDSPDFEIHTANCLGLVIVVSGSPID